MAFMRIFCAHCRGKWELYPRDPLSTKNAATCPHCGSRIDEHTWTTAILPAFEAVSQANESVEPYFHVDVISEKN